MRPNKYTESTGQRFNKLILLKLEFFQKENTKNSQYYWLCECNCGNKLWIRADRVHTQKSCGCIRKEIHRLEKGVAARNSYYSQYKTSAKLKELEFTLTVEQFANLTSGACHYCGDIPSLIRSYPRGWGGYIHNGIDRIDSSKGYTLDNCVSCCKTCNFAKNTTNYFDFLAWIERLIKFRSNK